jgi:uncharacterized membrane protein YkoI
MNTLKIHTASAILAAALALGIGGVRAWAGDDGQGSHENGNKADHGQTPDNDDLDTVYKSVRQGDLMPLSKIRPAILARWPGEMVAVDIKRDGAKTKYEFRVLRADGHLLEIEVDAATGEPLEVENE